MSPSPSPHAPPDRERGVKSILRFAKTDLIFEKNCLLANGALFNPDDYIVRADSNPPQKNQTKRARPCMKKWNRTKTIYYDEVMKSLEWIDSCKPGIIREIETQIVRLPFMKEGEENKMLTAIRQFLEKDVIIKYTKKLLNRFKNK
ncbi:MAG: hypothetical protein SGI98_10275 [Verrucomicrobiota bacterium]|nr:hypothetical protein [Verrucomicrobiota bacterium]